MNPDVNIQISNIAVQLKNLAIQLENISQTKYLVKPNLSNQFENMGIQTLNIGMQIICIGIMKRNSANENPNLGQQLKDLGNQILNFGLSLDNNNNNNNNNNNQIPMDMQKLINQKMNFIPDPEIWTLKFSYKYKDYEVYIPPTRSVQDAINLFKVQANIINNMEMKFMIGSFPLSPHLEIGKSGLVSGSIIFVSTPTIFG